MNKKHQNMLIIYHRIDLDGMGSCYLVWKKFKDDYNIDVLPHNYNEEPITKINFKKYDEIYMVDILDKNIIDKYLSTGSNATLTIIDHHQHDKEYIEKLKSNPKIITVINTNLAAIQLTSEFLYGIKPLFVELLGDYDRWNNKDEHYWNEKVMPFQMYMRTLVKSPFDSEWDRLYHSDLYTQECIKKGKGILEYDKKLREDTVKEYMFEIEFEGYKTIACNTTLRGSRLFDSMWDENKYDLMMVFHYEPKLKKWTYHIYTTKTDKIDCSKLAKKYGGGGHKGAAGFRMKKCIIDNFYEEYNLDKIIKEVLERMEKVNLENFDKEAEYLLKAFKGVD